jgi:hypothetical protein
VTSENQDRRVEIAPRLDEVIEEADFKGRLPPGTVRPVEYDSGLPKPGQPRIANVRFPYRRFGIHHEESNAAR